jgi:hypothetical protein
MDCRVGAGVPVSRSGRIAHLCIGMPISRPRNRLSEPRGLATPKGWPIPGPKTAVPGSPRLDRYCGAGLIRL